MNDTFITINVYALKAKLKILGFFKIILLLILTYSEWGASKADS